MDGLRHCYTHINGEPYLKLRAASKEVDSASGSAANGSQGPLWLDMGWNPNPQNPGILEMLCLNQPQFIEIMTLLNYKCINIIKT